MRKTISLNKDWRFFKGDLELPVPLNKGAVVYQSKTVRKLMGPAAYHYDDSEKGYRDALHELRDEGWRNVDLPHDYIIDQEPLAGRNAQKGFFDYTNAWYRKHFSLAGENAEGKRVCLQFDGVAHEAVVYLNGILVKRSFAFATAFEVDISDFVFYDKENVIAVYVNGKEHDGWWYAGAGIYRDVRLVITDAVSIDLYGVYAPARKKTDGTWAVELETTLRNDGYVPAAVTVCSVILDKLGQEISRAQAEGVLTPREKTVLKYTAPVPNPTLWSPEKPELYTVRTEVWQDGLPADRNEQRIGFRTVTADAENGLLINGEKVFVNGVNCHQDFGLTGLAVPDNVIRYKLELLKQMGTNGYRTSHYPHSTATMDMLDEMGFMVVDETRRFESTEEGLSQLELLIKRDRNRPGVIFWSTGNEEPNHITDVGRRIHKAMVSKIRSLDPDRLILCAENFAPEQSAVFADCDVIGINYNLHTYDAVHSQYPDKAVLATECCSTDTTRDWYLVKEPNTAPDSGSRSWSLDHDRSAKYPGRSYSWSFLRKRPWVIGGYQWSGIDYRGEAQWPAIGSRSGAIDMFLQKKSPFYLNKSFWTKEPMVHIAPHWNWKGLEGERIEVHVYTNCARVELLLNGESLGSREVEPYSYAVWEVPYAPGKLEAVGFRQGQAVCADTRVTTKAPVRLRLIPENSARKDSDDLLLFTCTCLDEDGLEVPDAAPTVDFAAEGGFVVATGSDNCDHNRVSCKQRKMYAGRITVAVRPEAGADSVTLYAFADTLGVGKRNVALENSNERNEQPVRKDTF